MKPRPRTALIFGVTGQDGAYLAQSLLRRGFEVHGTSRDKESSSYANLRRLGIYEQVTCHSAVLGDFRNVVTVIKNVSPAHIYNLAAQSSVGLSFEQPVETIDSIMHGTTACSLARGCCSTTNRRCGRRASSPRRSFAERWRSRAAGRIHSISAP